MVVITVHSTVHFNLIFNNTAYAKHGDTDNANLERQYSHFSIRLENTCLLKWLYVKPELKLKKPL